jgi:hypothetical protein
MSDHIADTERVEGGIMSAGLGAPWGPNRREAFDGVVAHIRAAADWLEELPPGDDRDAIQADLCHALDGVESWMMDGQTDA